jgi:hypothetical protein
LNRVLMLRHMVVVLDGRRLTNALQLRAAGLSRLSGYMESTPARFGSWKCWLGGVEF